MSILFSSVTFQSYYKKILEPFKSFFCLTPFEVLALKSKEENSIVKITHVEFRNYILVVRSFCGKARETPKRAKLSIVKITHIEFRRYILVVRSFYGKARETPKRAKLFSFLQFIKKEIYIKEV